MSRPGFFEHAGLGLMLAIAGAATLTVFTPLLGHATALRLALGAVAGASLAHVLCRSTERAGRLVVPILWLAATATAWTLLSLSMFALVQMTLIALARAMYFHDRPLPALADLAMTGVAAAAALWALGTGSWLLTLWAFFLVQALATWIPLSPARATDPSACDDGFREAHASARAALDRLAIEHPSRTH